MRSLLERCPNLPYGDGGREPVHRPWDVLRKLFGDTRRAAVHCYRRLRLLPRRAAVPLRHSRGAVCVLRRLVFQPTHQLLLLPAVTAAPAPSADATDAGGWLEPPTAGQAATAATTHAPAALAATAAPAHPPGSLLSSSALGAPSPSPSALSTATPPATFASGAPSHAAVTPAALAAGATSRLQAATLTHPATAALPSWQPVLYSRLPFWDRLLPPELRRVRDPRASLQRPARWTAQLLRERHHIDQPDALPPAA